MLKDEIFSLVASLKEKNRHYLAETIEKTWDMTVLEYSKKLYTHSPSLPLEPELKNAFEGEFARIGYSDEERSAFLSFLEHTRTLQSTPHLGLSPTARMFAIDWLSTRGVDSAFYLVASFSGIPFSNSSWPGCINYGPETKLDTIVDATHPLYASLQATIADRERDARENARRISLLPSTMQDTLVYRSTVPQKMVEYLDALTPKMKVFYPQATAGDSFTAYASRAVTTMERHLFNTDRIAFFDGNEVVTSYLLAVLHNEEHPLYKILFDEATRNKVLEAFGSDTIWFYAPYTRGKYEKQEGLVVKDNTLTGKENSIPLTPESVRRALEEGKLCPATLLTFTAFTFLNSITCFGSFRQNEYLPAYRKAWEATGILNAYDIANAPVQNLTTGMFGKDILPVDIVLGAPFSPREDMLFGELLIEMRDLLLS